MNLDDLNTLKALFKEKLDIAQREAEAIRAELDVIHRQILEAKANTAAEKYADIIGKAVSRPINSWRNKDGKRHSGIISIATKEDEKIRGLYPCQGDVIVKSKTGKSGWRYFGYNGTPMNWEFTA